MSRPSVIRTRGRGQRRPGRERKVQVRDLDVGERKALQEGGWTGRYTARPKVTRSCMGLFGIACATLYIADRRVVQGVWDWIRRADSGDPQRVCVRGGESRTLWLGGAWRPGGSCCRRGVDREAPHDRGLDRYRLALLRHFALLKSQFVFERKAKTQARPGFLFGG